MKKILTQVFNIEIGEIRAVGLSLLLSFFMGIPRLFTVTAATSLFLANYSANNLPVVYIVIAIVIPVLGFARIYYEKRVSFFSLTAGTMIALVLALCCFYLLLLSTGAIWVTPVLLVWAMVEWVFSVVVFWNTADRLFTVRQAKRVYGLIGSGEVLALIVGGFFVPSLVRFIGTTNLLLFSIAGNILTLVNLLYIRRSFKSRLTVEKKEEVDDRGTVSESTPFYRDKYILFTFAIISFIYLSYYFADNAFYDRLQIRFPEPARLAGFLGQFFAIYGIINLIFKILVSGRLLTRFGVRGGLYTAPLVLGVCTASVVIVWMVSGSFTAVFWLVVMIKLLERVLVESVSRPAYQTLYQPLPPADSIRYQAIAETMVAQIAGGLSGLVLLVLNKVFSFTAIGHCVVFFFILVAWLIVSLLASREYRQALARVLRQRGLKGVHLSLNNAFTVRILEEGLKSHRPKEIIYCLDLLDELGHPAMEKLLLDLLGHPEDDVREAVYKKLEKLGSESSFESLKQRLEVDEPPGLLGALLRALAASGEMEAFDLLAKVNYIKDAGPEVKLGAMTGLIRYCGIEGAIAAGTRVLWMEKSGDPQDRAFAARVLGEVGIPQFYRSLLTLLKDDDINVRKTAIEAAGKLKNRKLWPYIIENLSVNAVRGTAIKALANGGEAALQELETAYRKTLESRARIVSIYGRIGGEKAKHLLVGKLDDPDRNLLFEVYKSLSSCGFQAVSGKLTTKIWNLIKSDLAYGTRVLAALNDVSGEAGTALLPTALGRELAGCHERIFLLLSFIYPPETIKMVHDNFSTGSPEKRSFALELFENTVDMELNDLILPFLEDIDTEARLQSLLRYFPEPALGLEDRLDEIASRNELWQSPWVRACAVEATMLCDPSHSEEIASSLLTDSAKLVRETARYVLDIPESDRQYGRKVFETDRLTTMERVKILKQVKLFNKVPGDILVQVACILEETDFEPGETVVEKGKMGYSVFIIADGEVRVHDGERTLSRLGKRKSFGELSVLSPEPMAASVSAVKKSRLLRLSQFNLRELLGDQMDFVRCIFQELCRRLRIITARAASKSNREKAPAAASRESSSEAGPDSIPVAQSKQHKELSSIEKVIALKISSIFSGTPDSIMAEIGYLTREIRIEDGVTIFEKGEPGTTMYVIVDGRVKVHVGEKTIVELGERQIIGEMAVLSMEPRSASVTAVADARLLALDQSALYDIMWVQNDVVWGIINELIRRIRRQARG